MADYSLTANSSMSSKGTLYWHTQDAEFYEVMPSLLPARLHRVARAEKGKRYESIAFLLRQQGDLAGSRRAALKAFRSPVLLDNLGSKTRTLVAAVVREFVARFRQHSA